MNATNTNQEREEEKVEKIKIKYHTDIQKIQKVAMGDFIDLRAAESVFIPFGKMVKVSLGISMQLPKGYEAHVVPRSSTFEKWGVICVNSMGIIDNSYCGDNDVWKFPAFCLEPRTMKNGVQGTMIHKGDRICQFRIVENQPVIEFEEVAVLGNKDRGSFGSTGVN